MFLLQYNDEQGDDHFIAYIHAETLKEALEVCKKHHVTVGGATNNWLKDIGNPYEGAWR